jgi:putative FmdB family regulatory protein
MVAVEYPMPLFEYECRGCGKRFEYLTREGQLPACPACKGAELQKLMSVFAAQSSTPAKSFADRQVSAATNAGACGACGDPRGPGACSIH